MAFDFFQLCNSYVSATRIAEDTRARRRVIIAQLPEDYSARTKKIQQQIKRALSDADIKTTVHLIRADLSLIRTTYRFLIGNDAEREGLLAQAAKLHANASAIRFFKKCGLDTWDLVLAAKTQAEAPPALVPDPIPETPDALQTFLRAAQGLVDDVRTTKSDHQRVSDENLALRGRIESIEKRLGALDIGHLEALLGLAQEVRGGLAGVPKPPTPPVSNYPDGPQQSDAFNKPVQYTEQFARNAKQIDVNSQKEMKRIVERLTSVGPGDPLIKCARRPGATGSLMSLKLYRMFVIWEDTPTALVFHWIESSGKPVGR